ncbi:pyruvate dehydrogenase (acetyl-transferring) E1 component subunit alpha [Oceanobacillus arenosus]|uniref:Pyruvate dehydrogenase (Acetyl-transferring) E1 component subunit alpha n=2 Tax=Oceanobacillus arenosus TaxID=1229153 RepID=A0A3D8Q1L1_9BACI|nr:pyruvate dehydrogenase (acetyl-transferring) E1 component subunit alpha [Oceanobacillus arenosus]
MLMIRRFDERAATLVDEGEVTGEVHQYIGQEAVAVGISSVIRKDDAITSNHRGHGHVLAKGGDVNLMMAELGGRTTGYCKGKGGSMHITSLDLGIYGTNGMVGQGVPIALGAAFANNFKGNDNVTITYFGEGASNEGAVHESMNMAAIWKLPLIFVCENNQYAVSFNAKDSTSVENIAERGKGYGIPSIVVDGMDVFAVREAAKEAVQRARNGEGPTLIECKTYRYFGHFAGEPHVLKKPYRTDEEIESHRQNDPIERLKRHLVEEGVDEVEFAEMEAKVHEIIEDGVVFMKESPRPTLEAALEDAYAVEHKTMPVKGWA